MDYLIIETILSFTALALTVLKAVQVMFEDAADE